MNVILRKKYARLFLVLLLALLINALLFGIIRNMVTPENKPPPLPQPRVTVDLIDPAILPHPEKPLPKKNDKPPLLKPVAEMPEPIRKKLNAPRVTTDILTLPEPILTRPSASPDMPYLGSPLLANNDTDLRVAVPTLKTKPEYPERARRMGVTGKVTVTFTVTPNGMVRGAEITEATPAGFFEEVVLRDIQRWRFKPQLKNGKPVAYRTKQTIRFTLEQ